jgi:hypothetical protein
MAVKKMVTVVKSFTAAPVGPKGYTASIGLKDSSEGWEIPSSYRSWTLEELASLHEVIGVILACEAPELLADMAEEDNGLNSLKFPKVCKVDGVA